MTATKTYREITINSVRTFLIILLTFVYVQQPLSFYIYQTSSFQTEFHEFEGEEDFGEEETEDFTHKLNYTETFFKRKTNLLSEMIPDGINTRDKINAYKEFQSEIPVPPPQSLWYHLV